MPYSTRAAASSRPASLAVIALIAALLLTALASTGSANAAPVAHGFKDHSYGPSIFAPTEDKPQSKVWFADGFWWAGMFVDGSDDYRIHKYNASSHTWAATPTIVDERNSSHGDYLWHAATNSLYVASVNGDTDVAPILVFKFTYDPASDTYALDPDFRTNQDADAALEPGIIVGQGPSETVTIARDSTGQLWVTFQNPVGGTSTDRKVMVNRSEANEHTWGTAFQEGTDTGPDDISAIVAFGGNAVGIMWSEHRVGDTQSAFHFISHSDATADDMAWSSMSSITGAATFAEDHINLKLTTTGGGEILAALKTNASANHIQLFKRSTSGTWTGHPVVGDNQDVTRPQVVVDETNDRVYVFYTTPESVSDPGDQAIYYKSAPLSTLQFTTSGLGTPFIQDPGNEINDISTAKHNVTSATGLVAIASSDTNTSYYHGYLSLGAVANREVVRVAGANRYATAAEISELRFPTPGASFPEVFVATGTNFPDALSAGPAANLVGAPILLVSQGNIPDETKAELTRLGPAKITIVGGTSQVSSTVETQLQAYASSVVRIAGTNRYDTAEQVSLRFAANRPAVFIASGTGFPDALSAGPAASLLDVPILLTEQTNLPADTRTALTRLAPATIYVVGGTGVVSDAVKNALVQYTDSKTAGAVVRLSGTDRFGTNVAVVQRFWTSTVARSAIANGMNFPDALAEGAYQLPLHLVQPTAVPAVVRADIARINPDRIDALGGTTQISEGVLAALRIRP